jgi:hypothetical protein
MMRFHAYLKHHKMSKCEGIASALVFTGHDLNNGKAR